MKGSTGFCGACGEPNSYDDAFCVKCGKRLAWAAIDEESIKEISPEPPPENAQTESTPTVPVKFAAPLPQYEWDKTTDTKPQSHLREQWDALHILTKGFVITVGAFIGLCILGIIFAPPPDAPAATPTPAPAIAPHTVHIKPTPISAAQRLAKKQAAVAQQQAQKKADAEREAAEHQLEIQASQPPKPDEQLQQQDDKFGAVLKAINAKYGFPLVTNSGTEDDGDTIIIQVDDAWHSMNKQVRLENAQLMGNAWATIHGDYVENHRPRREATPGISIVDNAGNEVGGYSGWKGFWVQD